MKVSTSAPGLRPGTLPGSLISRAIDALGTEQFLPSLLQGFNSIGEFSHLFSGKALGSEAQFSPCIGYQRKSFEGPATMPLRSIDAQDPMYLAARQVLNYEPIGTAFVGIVASHEIVNPLRRELIFTHNSLSTRIGLSMLTPDGIRHFICLYRLERSGSFSNSQRSWLVRAAPVALSLLRKHREMTAARLANLDSHPSAPLRQLCPELTERELQVCAGLLRARTMEQIAAQLDIGATTVRTYQQRAFAKLAIRTRRELFEKLAPE